MASVPIVTPLGHLVGVLNVHTRQRREFTATDVELLRSVAGLVAGAIENARLHWRLAEREEALEQFAERTVEWTEHERRRLAGEIHDGISQRIVSLFFHLSAAADAIPGDPETAAEQVAPAPASTRRRSVPWAQPTAGPWSQVGQRPWRASRPVSAWPPCGSAPSCSAGSWSWPPRRKGAPRSG